MGRGKLAATGIGMACAITMLGGVNACMPEPQSMPAPSNSQSSDPTTPPPPSISKGPTPAVPETKATPEAPRDPSPPGAFPSSANSGTVLLTLDGAEPPVGAACTGIAQRTESVLSGGGGLAGAAVPLGQITVAVANEIALLPGTYNFEVRCTSGGNEWQGDDSDFTVVRGEQSELRISLAQSLP